jgi:MoaA/NifB/PqqE/SkfB family radical SAM enzyme
MKKISYDRSKQIRVIENSLRTLTFPEKIYNFVLNYYEIKTGKKRLRSKPLFSVFSPIAVCNYRCKFCESNSQYKGVKEVFPNSVSFEDFLKMKLFGSRTLAVYFYGNAGEPLLNRDFSKIAKYLKKKGVFLGVTTNGSMLTRELADELVKIGFDDFLVSFHAGKKETYEFLQNKTFDKVTENVRYLAKIKKRYPKVVFNFALNQINGKEIAEFVKLCKDLKINGIQSNHYYHCKNFFEEDISYVNKTAEGNELVDRLYDLARKENLFVHPEKRNYLKKKEDLANPGRNAKPACQCVMPYQNLNFYGSFMEKDTFDICVCNRFFPFKLNYREFMGQDIDLIWNHPILQYLRKTLGKNPICSFCQSKETPILRNADNKKYIRLRDEAIRNFLKEAAQNSDIRPIKGLTVLEKNIYGES